jgi:hypothetical protein
MVREEIVMMRERFFFFDLRKPTCGFVLELGRKVLDASANVDLNSAVSGMNIRSVFAITSGGGSSEQESHNNQSKHAVAMK